jgi:hypothetical protein
LGRRLVLKTHMGAGAETEEAEPITGKGGMESSGFWREGPSIRAWGAKRMDAPEAAASMGIQEIGY